MSFSDIRRATAEDWQTLRSLRLEALRTDPDSFGSDLASALRTPETEWRRWARSSAIFFAEEDGQAVGMAGCTPHGQVGHLQLTALWVHPTLRGTGMGRRLVGAVLARAKERNAECLFLWVNVENTAARRLYESLGFSTAGIVRPLFRDRSISEAKYTLSLRSTETR